MDEKNKDLRPKRRKAKDNPYTLISVMHESGSIKYYIRFKDVEGREQSVEVDKDLYDVFDRFELDDISQLHKIEKYGTVSFKSNIEDLSETALNNQRFIPGQESFQFEDLYQAIGELTKKQRRYLELHFFSGYTCREIAKMEDCSFQNVANSLKAALRVLRDIMQR